MSGRRNLAKLMGLGKNDRANLQYVRREARISQDHHSEPKMDMDCTADCGGVME